MNFSSLKLQPWIINTLKELNITKTTDIQSVVFSKHNNDKSLLITAPTGRGKTICFSLNILNSIDFNTNKIQALIVLPTKELANQIYNHFLSFKQFNKKLSIKLLNESKSLKLSTNNAPQIIIGSPNKINDCVNINKHLIDIKYFVLDEADMLIDFGFYHTIENIFDKINSKQLKKYALSASLHHSLANQLKKFLGNTKVISTSDSIWINPQLNHYLIYENQHNNPMETLQRLLKIINPFFAIIFANTKKDANLIYEQMITADYNVALLHKDLTSRQRKGIFSKAKNNQFQYLIATDLMARGVDLPQADLVISYGLPSESIWYIHRSGRVGRYKDFGTSYVIYHNTDDYIINNLIKKGIKFKYLLINNHGQLIDKQFKLRLRKKIQFDLKTNNKIRSLVTKSLKRGVKPGYKKKLKAKINRIKQHSKHQYIEKKIKQQLLMENINRTKKEHNK